MTRRNITLTGVLLLILLTLIGIERHLDEAKALQTAELNLKTVSAPLVSRLSVRDVHRQRDSVLNSKNVVFRQEGALDVTAKELSGASLDLLDA
jgi:hypothetical protein